LHWRANRQDRNTLSGPATFCKYSEADLREAMLGGAKAGEGKDQAPIRTERSGITTGSAAHYLHQLPIHSDITRPLSAAPRLPVVTIAQRQL
jgi:hypothetical protein